jgi:hypothetical protein
MIDPELEKYYNNYHDLFMSTGWKQLLEDLVGNSSVINSVEATKDSNDLYFRKGQLSIIANLVNLESQITAAEEQANEEDDAE